jgi:hypothetical protein
MINGPKEENTINFFMKDAIIYGDTPIHCWFELSYAQYLTVPRSVMEAMPIEWQERMVKCLEELDDTFAWRPSSGRYWVKLKNDKGYYEKDPLMEYRHPDREYIESIEIAST